jgi:hypothetical protein
MSSPVTTYSPGALPLRYLPTTSHADYKLYAHAQTGRTMSYSNYPRTQSDHARIHEPINVYPQEHTCAPIHVILVPVLGHEIDDVFKIVRVDHENYNSNTLIEDNFFPQRGKMARLVSVLSFFYLRYQVCL